MSQQEEVTEAQHIWEPYSTQFSQLAVACTSYSTVGDLEETNSQV